MKKFALLFAILTFNSVVFADNAAMIVGKWRTISENCEKNGSYINGYLEQTKFIKVLDVFDDKTVIGEQHSADNSIQLSFKGTYEVSGDDLISTITQSTVNGVSQQIQQFTNSKISFVGTQMVISHQITEAGKACPIGDNTITVFDRL